jgi:hypothetical protein
VTCDDAWTGMRASHVERSVFARSLKCKYPAVKQVLLVIRPMTIPHVSLIIECASRCRAYYRCCKMVDSNRDMWPCSMMHVIQNHQVIPKEAVTVNIASCLNRMQLLLELGLMGGLQPAGSCGKHSRTSCVVLYGHTIDDMSDGWLDYEMAHDGHATSGSMVSPNHDLRHPCIPQILKKRCEAIDGPVSYSQARDRSTIDGMSSKLARPTRCQLPSVHSYIWRQWREWLFKRLCMSCIHVILTTCCVCGLRLDGSIR